jgi:hypothetical protein
MRNAMRHPMKCTILTGWPGMPSCDLRACRLRKRTGADTATAAAWRTAALGICRPGGVNCRFGRALSPCRRARVPGPLNEYVHV